jgi:signal transduction histidine kinase
MTEASRDPSEVLIVSAAVGRHLALAPVAFAVTEGDAHALVYANTLFHNLQAAGHVRIAGRDQAGAYSAGETDLTPLLDDAFQGLRTIRDAMLEPPAGGPPRWSCSVWPVTDAGDSKRLVIAVRDVELVEGAKERQRVIAERLLLAALREQDLARDAHRVSDREHHLAAASRDLALSLDERSTRDTVRQLALPRPGSWCIVDVLESNGAICRLAVVHPDPAKQQLAQLLEKDSAGPLGNPVDTSVALQVAQPTVVMPDSGEALMRAVHGRENLEVLRQIGFGSLLVVPLIVRARVQGTITFVSEEGDKPFDQDEIAHAVDLAARCAMALDNARLYREADVLRVAAQAANQSKSAFLGSMSHELRTPLNAIGGFTELISEGIEGPVTERQRVSLARIKANQQHLLKLITEILNFVRIESGRMEYNLGPVSLNHAFKDVAEMLSGAVAQKDLILDVVFSDTDVVAWGDPDRVRQILVNLVMNAVKYTPVGGGTITLECAVVGDHAVAHVSDTGPGIPDDHVQSVFEPFVQLMASLTDRRGGVGLGLPISRDLARAMAGDLTVDSTRSVGSRFTLTLPRQPPADSPR